MPTARLTLLRGVCQTPAYVAHEKGFFADEGLSASIEIAPTAWMAPNKLAAGQSEFALIPWTRAAAAQKGDAPLVVVCGSGHEEAAIVVRAGLEVSDVKRVTVPLRGGMKDLTAMALIESLGWQEAEILRQPSGDGAIISLFGQGCDAASMVEPYATMMETLGVGRVVRRTGDVWPDAPGCSLTTTAAYRDANPDVVEAVVRAFARGADFVEGNPGETAAIASRYIGVNEAFIEQALTHNAPQVDAIRQEAAVERILSLMVRLGYLEETPSGFLDLSFLEKMEAGSLAPP
jgi:ABC-type nitrate/sulfonate/bicarbonate transport system substrate-binding protein